MIEDLSLLNINKNTEKEVMKIINCNEFLHKYNLTFKVF